MLADGAIADVFIRDQWIAEIGPRLKQSADREIDLRGKLLLPGIIDVHTHIRDMGQSAKETWPLASRAAVKGGITSICDMPNTKPPTFDIPALREKRRAAEKSLANPGYNFGVTGKNFDQIRTAAPINALKVFMTGSSGGYVVQDKAVLREVFALAAELGKPLIVHSELQRCVENEQSKYPQNIENHDLLRNRSCAIKATEMLLGLSADSPARLYLAHISTGEEIDLIRAAKAENPHLYCEVTPQHLFINKTILSTAGNYGKVNPPLRLPADNEALQQAVIDGTVDSIGSDHAPHTLEEKNRSYALAPSGFPGLETSLALMLQMVQSGQISYGRLQELMCTNPAEIFKMKKRGQIKTGFYADLILVDAAERWTVRAADFETKAKYTPYEGMTLTGRNRLTIINGRVVYDNGTFYDNRGMEIEYR